MGEHNDAIRKGHMVIPGSPTGDHNGHKRKHTDESSENTLPGPNTPPQDNPNKKTRNEGSYGSSSVIAPLPQVQGESSYGASPVPFELDRMVGNLETMVKMLKRVRGAKGLMSDPVMACFVSAQTVIMACTAELVSRRATQPRVRRIKQPSTNQPAKHP